MMRLQYIRKHFLSSKYGCKQYFSCDIGVSINRKTMVFTLSCRISIYPQVDAVSHHAYTNQCTLTKEFLLMYVQGFLF